MMFQRIPSALLLTLGISFLAQQANAHAFLSQPLARSGCPTCNGYCPHCLNAGGVGAVSSIVPVWPAYETEETTIRHALCGDPANSDRPFDTPGPVVASYAAGDVVEFSAYVSAHHQGHFEFRVCDISDGKTMSQTCFNEIVLQRAEHPDTDSPIDTRHPERWYLPQRGRGYYHNIYYKIPDDLQCTHCVLQWYYMTANSCNPPDYDLYFQEFPELNSWWTGVNLGWCGPKYGEEFWNCADISVLNSSPSPTKSRTPSVTPTISHTPSVTPTISDTASVTPTISNSASRTPAPSVTPSRTPTISASSSAVQPGCCTGCVSGSSGFCQDDQNVCWPFMSGTTSCPSGTTLCGTTPSSSTTSTSSRTASVTATPAPSSDAAPSASATVSPTHSGGGGNNPGKKVIGYYNNMAVARGGLGRFLPEDIDTSLVTHVVYSFAKLTADTHKVIPGRWDDYKAWNVPSSFYYRFIAHVAGHATPVLSISGESDHFSAMAASAASRTTFVSSAISFVREHGFQGIDIAWDSPQGTADKNNFVDLMQELHAAVVLEAGSTGSPQLTLSITASGDVSGDSSGYDAATLHAYTDWISVSAFDYFTYETQSFTGAVSPLSSVQASITQWLSGGTPSDKLVLGLASHGRTWRLADASQHGLGATAWSGGAAGPYTGRYGWLSFLEIQEKLSQGWSEEFDAASQTKYAHSGSEWVSFDDTDSITAKLAEVDTHCLGGASVSAIDMDDFHNGFPLLSAVAAHFATPYSRRLTTVSRMQTFLDAEVDLVFMEGSNTPELQHRVLKASDVSESSVADLGLVPGVSLPALPEVTVSILRHGVAGSMPLVSPRSVTLTGLTVSTKTSEQDVHGVRVSLGVRIAVREAALVSRTLSQLRLSVQTNTMGAHILLAAAQEGVNLNAKVLPHLSRSEMLREPRRMAAGKDSGETLSRGIATDPSGRGSHQSSDSEGSGSNSSAVTGLLVSVGAMALGVVLGAYLHSRRRNRLPRLSSLPEEIEAC